MATEVDPKVTALIGKLTELNWPKKVTMPAAQFWPLWSASGVPLKSIAGHKGTSELSFMCEVTEVFLSEPVTRPDTADMTEHGAAHPATVIVDGKEVPQTDAPLSNVMQRTKA
jgi:hypothetical protein